MNFNGENYFNSLNMFGIRLGLDATRDLLNLAGHPEKKLKFIHIAGTNGKGSVGAMLECALRHAGFITGFYTSPHLLNIRERFRINGIAISQAEFDAEAEIFAKLAKNGNFSYFEQATVLAAHWFAKKQVQIAIWETGLGGRLDATNAITPELSIITNIARDHQDKLGYTLAAIATEKAGIIKPGVPLIYGELPLEAKEVILAKSKELGAVASGPSSPTPPLLKCIDNIQYFNYENQTIGLSLAGAMQRENFRIVHRALQVLCSIWNFDINDAIAGLTSVQWPARFQRLNSHFYVDGGHNPDGVRALIDALTETFPEEKFAFVYGAFKDKKADECVHQLAKYAQDFYFVPVPAQGRNSYSGAELSAMLPANSTANIHCFDEAITGVETALRTADCRVIVAGSLFLAGAVLKKFVSQDHVLNLQTTSDGRHSEN